MNWNAFLEQLGEWLELRGLLSADAAWVVGVSGGPDSTLLLHAMQTLSERRNLRWRLHAAHVHHGLRGPEADEDQRCVERMTQRLGVACHVEREDVKAWVAKEGGSAEEVARRRRYAALERIALRSGSEHVAVGHHADDNVETILHRICRGTGLRGLGGIADVRPIHAGSRIKLVRPLLDLRRETIAALCAQRGLATRADSSNASEEFTRNRVRHTVLPLLRQTLNPNVDEALLRLGEQARWLSGYLEEAAARTLAALELAAEPGRVVLSAPALLAKHRAIQAEVARRAIALVADAEPEPGFAHVEAVLRLARNGASGKELHLPGRVVVRKRYDRLEFTARGEDEPVPETGPVLVECPGGTALPLLGVTLVADVCEVNASKIAELRATPTPGEEWLDYERLRPPLFVRRRRPGDRFHPLGAPGVKTIADFLTDEKVEPRTRARTGVLCDQDGPVWVMPWRIDERVKLTPATRRALRVTLRPLAPPPPCPPDGRQAAPAGQQTPPPDGQDAS